MGDDQIGLCFLGALDQQPCRIRIQPVIAVYKLQIGSVGAFNGEIARSRYTAVLFVDNAKSGVALGVMRQMCKLASLLPSLTKKTSIF